MIAYDQNMLVLVSGALLVIFIVQKLLKMMTAPKLPPGPTPLPVIGNLHQLASRPDCAHITFNELANKYGDMVTISIFNTKFILLNSYEICQEVFVKHADAFSNRPMTTFFNLINQNEVGLVFQEGNVWKDIRRITVSSIRDFGFGKKSMESKTREEASALADVFASHQGKPFDALPFLTEAAGNLICSICFGSRFDYNDKEFRTLVGKMRENMNIATFFEPIDHISILRLFPLPKHLKRQLVNLKDIDDYIVSQIEAHRATFDKNNLRDFIDLYLNKEGDENTEDALFTDGQIKMIIRDLFFAGTANTSMAMYWAILFLITYPEIQERLSEEMAQVVGPRRQPSMADQQQMNYLQAFTLETLRYGCLAFMTVPHECSVDTQIGRYTIPKGATVLGNIYSVHMSERYWENPTQFNPNRFLDDNGKFMNIKEGFIAFGTGLRRCVGEIHARMQISSVLACLIQRFKLRPGDENELLSLQGKSSVVLSAKPFKIMAIPKY